MSAAPPILFFATRAEWRKWIAANHAKSPGVWVKLAKSGAGVKSVAHPEVLEEALRYGWIDAQTKSLGADFWLKRFMPRKPKSIWSKVNRASAEALIASGKMKPAGLREAERAKADGRWDAAYESQSKATVPDDLTKALARDKKARAFFESLDSKNRYAILHRLHLAKKPETRARRLEKFVAMLRAGEKIHN